MCTLLLLLLLLQVTIRRESILYPQYPTLDLCHIGCSPLQGSGGPHVHVAVLHISVEEQRREHCTGYCILTLMKGANLN